MLSTTQNNKKFTVADYLLTRLQQLGLTKVFQVAGDLNVGFMDALERNKHIDSVTEVNELCAGYAADGYARLNGIGAVSLQFGVGNFSAFNAVAGSYMEKNPVVVISASPSAEGRVLVKELDVLFHHATYDLNADAHVFKSITAAAEILRAVELAPTQIDQALVAAITKKEPVYFEAYMNVWDEECPEPTGQLKPAPQPSLPKHLAAAVLATQQLMQSSKQIVVLLGVEIDRFNLQEDINIFLKNTGLLYATTIPGKSVLDERSGLFIGTYAGAASFAETRMQIEKADCILALGCIMTTDYLYLLQNKYAQLILINDRTIRVGYQTFNHVNMIDYIATIANDSKNWKLPQPIKSEPNIFEIPKLKGSKASTLSYTIFIRLLYQHLQEYKMMDQITLILGTSSAIYTAANYRGFPQNSFINDQIWGSIGHATGCSTGAYMANGKRPIVIAGDGGFMMICQTLSTLASHKISAVVFVMSNAVYAIEQAAINIDAFKPGGHFEPYNLLAAWDYPALAKAYGAQGFQVTTAQQLKRVLKLINTIEDRPTLVEVEIPKKDLTPELKRLVEGSR